LVEKNRTAKRGSLNTIIGSTTVGWGGGMWWTRWLKTYGTQSPYHFAGNNPINNMETNGAFWQEAVADGIERDIDEWGNVASGGTGTRTTYRGPTTFFGSGGYYGNYSAGGNYLGSTFTGTFGGSTYTRMNMGRGFPEYTYNGGYYRDGNGNIVDWSEVEASLVNNGDMVQIYNSEDGWLINVGTEDQENGSENEEDANQEWPTQIQMEIDYGEEFSEKMLSFFLDQYFDINPNELSLGEFAWILAGQAAILDRASSTVNYYLHATEIYVGITDKDGNLIQQLHKFNINQISLLQNHDSNKPHVPNPGLINEVPVIKVNMGMYFGFVINYEPFRWAP
jgi:hypothetical protein